MLERKPLYGAIEAGGTKFICAVGWDSHNILDEIMFPTTTPAETLERVTAFFKSAEKALQPLKAIGVGSFGPVNINPASKHLGRILETPKVGWTDVNILKHLSAEFEAELFIDTDVNCALKAEVKWGAGRGLKHVAYVTVGTGIGGGFYINGKMSNGFTHPEIGHLHLSSLIPGDEFEGVCPYHGNMCFEGVASGPAIIKRWNSRPHELPIDHKAWTYEAEYLAILCQNIILTMSPERIIMGGGVMKQTHLYPMIKTRLKTLLNGYLNIEPYELDWENFLVPQGLVGQAGIMGGLELARQS